MSRAQRKALSLEERIARRSRRESSGEPLAPMKTWTPPPHPGRYVPREDVLERCVSNADPGPRHRRR